MRTVDWRGILRVGGFLVVATLLGCSTSSRPPISQLQQGLNLLDTRDPSWGMNAAYVKNNRVVYIETRIGPLKPDVYRQAYPNDPPNETDLRFVDQNGNTFFVQRGGDNFVDPSWNAEIERSRHTKIDPVQRAQDFLIAKEAAAAIGKLAPASFKDHIFYLKNFAAQPAPSQNQALQARALEIAKQPLPAVTSSSPQGYGQFNNGNWSWLETDLYSGDTGCFAWICSARHSATIMFDCEYNGSSCDWVFAINACNHGRCYSDDGMSYQCYSNGGWYWNATISGEDESQYTGGTAISNGCQTPYNWDSGGYDHLCNDDAAYELWQAKAYTGNNGWYASTSQGDGYSFVWTANAHYACDCNNNSGCDGDWSQPACP